MSRTEDMNEIEELSVSNFDGAVPEELADRLKAGPNEVYANHYARDFYGVIYYDGRQFVEEVQQYGRVIDVLNGDTLAEVVESANDQYGDD